MDTNNNESELYAAVKNLEELAQRWEDTPCWHNPVFRDGQISISTGKLHDIYVVIRWIKGQKNNKSKK